jgi:hypothetical protein
MESLLPYSRIVRNQIHVSIKISFIILLWCHTCVILWLFAGSTELMGEKNLPWIEANPRISAYDHY